MASDLVQGHQKKQCEHPAYWALTETSSPYIQPRLPFLSGIPKRSYLPALAGVLGVGRGKDRQVRVQVEHTTFHFTSSCLFSWLSPLRVSAFTVKYPWLQEVARRDVSTLPCLLSSQRRPGKALQDNHKVAVRSSAYSSGIAIALKHEIHDTRPIRAIFGSITPHAPAVVPSAGFEAELGVPGVDAAERRPCRRSSCSPDRRIGEAGGM